MRLAFSAGTTWEWTVPPGDYDPSSDTLTLYALGPERLEITATASADGQFAVLQTPVQTAPVVPGVYTVRGQVTQGAAVYSHAPADAVLIVSPNLTVDVVHDVRSTQERELEMVDRLIRARLTEDVAAVSGVGGSVTRESLKTLYKRRALLRAAIARATFQVSRDLRFR